MEEVRNAGYTDEQLIEMVATVNLATFTNYMNDFMGTEVDLPVQEPTDGR
jgi:alkylhydroperoxidase family enzyme